MKTPKNRFLLLLLSFGNLAFLAPCLAEAQTQSLTGIQHVHIFQKDGRFAAWPANGGIWKWGNEILVGFIEARYAETNSLHTYDPKTARHKYARSLDNGVTWSIEDAYSAGHTARAYDHYIEEDKSVAAKPLTTPMNFTHPEFVLSFVRLNNNHDGPSIFYHSNDRGKSWKGPFSFPNLGTPGVATRNDYLVEGEKKLMAFLTVAKNNKREGRVANVRTSDGGLTWEMVGWIGPEPEGFDIMPSTKRISENEILTTFRTRQANNLDLMTAHRSINNGASWSRIQDPVADTGHGGSPPALVQLSDGRLALGYAYRSQYGSRLCVRFSSNNGRTWSNEIPLRQGDGANRDIGYPAMIQRADGKLVIVYYWNNALQPGAKPYRYIAATIFEPDFWK